MALEQSDNLLAISDNAISIINKSLSSHIKQIQIDCKESIEQHIKKEMTLYYGVINGNNHPVFSDITISKSDSEHNTYTLKFTETQLYYTKYSIIFYYIVNHILPYNQIFFNFTIHHSLYTHYSVHNIHPIVFDYKANHILLHS